MAANVTQTRDRLALFCSPNLHSHWRTVLAHAPPLPDRTDMHLARAHRTLTIALAAALVLGAVAILILAYTAECRVRRHHTPASAAA